MIPLLLFIQSFLDGCHEDTWFYIQRICDFEKGFQCGLAFAPLDGTQVRPADAGKTADQFLRLLFLLPKFLNNLTDYDRIQHYTTPYKVSVKHKLTKYEYIC